MPRFTGKRDRGESIDNLNVNDGATIGGTSTLNELVVSNGVVISGAATITGVVTLGTGNVNTLHAGVGAAWGTIGTPALIGQQKYATIVHDGTTYRIPLFANA